MKKFILSVLVTLFTVVAFSQDTTLQSGSYGHFSYNSTFTRNIIVAPNAVVTFTDNNMNFGSSSALIDIKPGATATFSNGLQASVSVLVESSATLNVIGNYNINGGKFTVAGNSDISNTLTGGGNSIILSNNCSFIKTKNLSFSNDNIVSGTGLIYVTTDYSNQYSNQYYTGHPLTTSSTIFINTSNTTGNIGSAQRSSNTSSACSIATPVQIINESFVSNSNKQVTATWTTTSETNNDYFVIEASKDGKTWVDVKVVSSYYATGNGSTSHTYSVVIENSIMVAQAGVGLGVLAFLFTGKGKRRKSIGIALTLGMVFLVACSKQNVSIKNLESNYKQFRLKQVDKDGNIHYIQKVFQIS